MKITKALIVAGGGIGDVLMATPMIRAVAAENDNVQISVLVVSGVNRQVLQSNPDVFNVFVWKEFENDKLNLIKLIQKEGFEIAIHSHGSTRNYFHAIPLLAGIPIRLGFNRRPLGGGIMAWVRMKTLTSSILYSVGEAKRTRMNLDLLRFCGIENDDESYVLSSNEPAVKNQGMIGFHPGCDAKGEIKRWPIERFVALGKKLIDQKCATKVSFYLGPSEQDLKSAISGNAGFEVVEAKSIGELSEKMSLCEIFVSNDSGLSHVAAALKLPTVVLFGPTTPQEYILPTLHRNIEMEDRNCSGCFQRKKCQNFEPSCMVNISVDCVLEAVQELQSK
ncbi:MAG: heptosyltransferase-2 [Flammeovirgaceae bacterium]|jgi:heptosyltransferase-2